MLFTWILPVSFKIPLVFLHIFNIIQKYVLPANRWNLHGVDWTWIRLCVFTILNGRRVVVPGMLAFVHVILVVQRFSTLFSTKTAKDVLWHFKWFKSTFLKVLNKIRDGEKFVGPKFVFKGP